MCEQKPSYSEQFGMVTSPKRVKKNLRDKTERWTCKTKIIIFLRFQPVHVLKRWNSFQVIDEAISP